MTVRREYREVPGCATRRIANSCWYMMMAARKAGLRVGWTVTRVGGRFHAISYRPRVPAAATDWHGPRRIFNKITKPMQSHAPPIPTHRWDSSLKVRGDEIW